MNLDKYHGKKVAILGLGMEGIALAKIFKEKNLDFYLLDKLSIYFHFATLFTIIPQVLDLSSRTSPGLWLSQYTTRQKERA